MSRSRRRFLQQAVTAGAAGLFAGEAFPAPASPSRAGKESRRASQRPRRAYQVRVDAAQQQRARPLPPNTNNGDEERYPSKIACFSKGLPHDSSGEVDRAAYGALVAALRSGSWPDLESVPLGGSIRFANPQAAYAFSLEGVDSHRTTLATPPAFSSGEQASEAAELYWSALMRDVPFVELEQHPLAEKAAADLSRFSDFRGPRTNGRVTPATLFRGNVPGDLTGPYVSQFLWKELSFGSIQVFQKIRTYYAEYDYLTTEDEWLASQNGKPGRKAQLGAHRYIRNGRDLAAYVQVDFTYQAFVNAALILFSMQGSIDANRSYRGAPYDRGNPYRTSRAQAALVTFGQAHILDLVGRVTLAALKAAWYHKWLVHRRLRPEEYCGRIHRHLTGRTVYPLHADILNSSCLTELHKNKGTYLLPQAYPEGSPIHPAYPGGHAVIAGACVSVLKAFFDEEWPIDDPVIASADGLRLSPYRGPELSVGGELNKLASNVSFGRNLAGIHWRSDEVEGMRLGEEVAISILQDWRRCYAEPFDGFSLTKFDGRRIHI